MEDRRNEFIYGPQGGPAYPRQPAVARTFAGQQPYAQPRAQTSLVPQDTQVLTQNGFKPLTKEERAEAARIAEEAGFSFDGYQVVRREFFSHKFDPTLTIRGNSIIFNNACISKMESVVYVQVLVNPTTEKLVIRPCEEGARDSIRWCIVKDDKRKSRQITCGLFTAKLYEMMGWEQLYRYKMQGTRINYKGQHLYVFDLTSTEVFLPAVKDPDNPKARARRSAAVYPTDWRDSFGIPVQEHEASMQIDLMEGFTFADVAQRPGTTLIDGQPLPDGAPEQEQLPMEIIDQETGEVIKI